MRIIIGVDTVPTASNEILFKNGDVDKLLGASLFRCFGQQIFEFLTWRHLW